MCFVHYTKVVFFFKDFTTTVSLIVLLQSMLVTTGHKFNQVRRYPNQLQQNNDMQLYLLYAYMLEERDVYNDMIDKNTDTEMSTVLSINL